MLKKLRRKLTLVLSALAAALTVVLLITAILTNIRLRELTTRLTYMQDTTDVIRTDLGGLQSELEQTLREENSFLETCTFSVIDADFAEGTYTVRIDAIPKEYTDKTKLSVFFGTAEYELERDGFRYFGTVVLPLDESYEGNVTMLITNGKTKNTEVLSEYEGFREQFDGILSGTMEKLPEYRRGRLSIREDISFTLEGADTYGVSDFSSLLLTVTAGEESIHEEELIGQARVAGEAEAVSGGGTADEAIAGMPEGAAGDPDTPGVPLAEDGMGAGETADDAADEELADDTETGDSRTTVSHSVEGLYGSTTLLVREQIAPQTDVLVTLSALSTDGYRFEYDLFAGTTDADGNGFAESENYFTGDYRVYDSRGNLFQK